MISGWISTNEYMTRKFFSGINSMEKSFPDSSVVRESREVIMNFRNILRHNSDSLQYQAEYIPSVHPFTIKNIIESTERICDTLLFLIENGDTLSLNEKMDFYNELYEKMHRINSQMLTINYYWSESFNKSILTYIKYFCILGIFILLTTITLLAIAVLESLRKDKKIKESSDYLRYIMYAQEEVSNKISRELHDTVAQDMRYILSLAETLEKNEIAGQIQDKLTVCINEVRSLCYNMMPPEIDNNDFESSIKVLCQKFKQESSISIKLSITEDVDFSFLNPEKMMNLYRIIQESLSNIQKHSGATEAALLFTMKTENAKEENMRILKIFISDDGKGIKKKLLAKINGNSSKLKQTNHFGIMNIKERVKLLGGTVVFNSLEGYGTEIHIVLPA